MTSPSLPPPFGARLLTATALVLAACTQPTSVREVDGALTSDGLVFACSSPEDQSWGAELDIENAPPADYFIFKSATRPTSMSGLATFAPADCRSSEPCVVVGLGEYQGLSTLTTAGHLSVRTAHNFSGGDYTKSTFFVLVRRTRAQAPAAPPAPAPSDLKVKAKVFIAAAQGGCGNPEAPDVQLSPL